MITSLPELQFTCGCERSYFYELWKQHKQLETIDMRRDLIFTVRNKYISYNLHPLTIFTSCSKIQNKGPYTKASPRWLNKTRSSRHLYLTPEISSSIYLVWVFIINFMFYPELLKKSNHHDKTYQPLNL